MLRYIGITSLALVIILLAAGFLMSKTFKAEQSIVIQANTSAIHTYVNDLKQWPKWTPWTELEPDTVTHYGDLTEGVGASQSWQGKGGNGRLHITASSPANGIAYDVFFGHNSTPSISAIEYQVVTDNSTRVTWRIQGEVDMPVVGGFIALMVNSMIQDMYHKGLLKLKDAVEKRK